MGGVREGKRSHGHASEEAECDLRVTIVFLPDHSYLTVPKSLRQDETCSHYRSKKKRPSLRPAWAA